MKLSTYTHETNYYFSRTFGISGIRSSAFTLYYRKNDMIFKYSRIDINSTYSNYPVLGFKI